ncbi:hypothetical protein CHARACLAT_017900 [Characodon lateralis]|uniref:Uncharacterized protein n=1 Tax=Characodon lateralis TaxID=208331 RepID=A0ABU7DS18_9TELE|nr:hypothetical protein [Characodon lateralis]
MNTEEHHAACSSAFWGPVAQSLNRMFLPRMDLVDSRQESARDRSVQLQMEEAMKHLPIDLEVLPSPLLLEQMKRETVQHRSLLAPLAVHRQ